MTALPIMRNLFARGIFSYFGMMYVNDIRMTDSFMI